MVEAVVPRIKERRPPGPIREFWSSFSENRGAVAGLVLVVSIILMALFAPLIAPHSPIEQFRESTKLPPAWMAGGDWRYRPRHRRARPRHALAHHLRLAHFAVHRLRRDGSCRRSSAWRWD